MSRTFLLLVAALCVSACTKRPPDPDAIRKGDVPAAEYYPLAVGNSWTYQARFLGQETEQTVKILRQSDGWFEDSTGGKLTVDAWGIRDEKRYLLRDPVTAGESWTNVVSVSSVERYKVIDSGVSCDVRGAHFDDCARVETSNRVDEKTVLINEITFARGVGIVRIQMWAQIKDGDRIPQTFLELKKFEKGSGAANKAEAP